MITYNESKLGTLPNSTTPATPNTNTHTTLKMTKRKTTLYSVIFLFKISVAINNLRVNNSQCLSKMVK